MDLGCGPGYSTRLLHEVVQADVTVGLDRSARFLETAAAQVSAPVHFLRHDVTRPLLPVRQPHVVYARFLLSHVREPRALAARWVGELAPGGRLLLDEVDSIEPHDEAGCTYQEVVESMLRHNGQRLDVGPLLDDLEKTTSALRVESDRVVVRPTSRQVGTMFSLNLRVWRHDPYLTATFGDSVLNALQRELDLAADGLRPLPVTWTMRQLTLTR